MHNCYISSTITIRSKGYLSFSFNDNCCLLNERIGKSSCSSCDCCAFSIHRLPINPSFLYGLRQSTLIHWSASRMLILGGGDRNCWLPDLERGCYGVSGSLRGRSISKRRIRGREGRFGCMVSEENGERYDSGVDGSAEAMLSLLTEEIGENCVGNGRLASRRARVEKRGHITDGCSGEEKENVGPNYLEMNSKSEFELVKIKAKEEGYMWSGGKEGSSRRENFGVRKEGSSCSSYYSVSYSGDIESDALVQAKHGVFPGESSSGYKKESRKNREKAFVEKVTEQFKSYGDDVGGNSEVSIQGNVAVGSYAMGSVEWNSRNTTEKNFTEVSSGQKISREESPQKHSKISKIWGSGTERVSSSHSKFNGKEENSTLAVNLVEETRDQRSQTGDRVTEHSESLRKTQQLTEMSEIQDSDFEMISSSQKQLSDMKGNITAAVNSVQETRDRNSQMVDQITGQNISRRKFQQLTKTSEFNDNDTQKNSISQRQTETEMEKIDDHSTSILSSAQVTREQSTQRGHQIIREIDSRGKSQPLGGMSEIHGSDIEKTPTSKKRSVTRMKNQDKSSTSVQEAKELCTATNQEVLGRSELRKESQDRINVSVIRACDTERVTDSQRLSEERITSQEENFTSVVDLIEETRERRNQSGGILYEQIGSREESRRPIKTSSFLENTSERASSSQKSLNSVRQAREQQIGARKEDETNSQVILMPPPSQLVARVSLDVEPTSGYTTKEFYSETSEIGSSALYTHPQGRRPALPNEQHDGTRKDETYEEPSNLIVHEDAFGSAHLIEKSSTQFVREFVEKSRHEGSTSEIQKERKSYEKQQGLSQYVFENLPISDEMLGVADLSFHEPPTTEAPECSPKTGGVTVKRTSRSLWSIIADVVRMRWGARAESHSSAVKSGGRSLSNELVGSEAWFSSHESDKNNDENVKRGRRSMPKEPRSTNQTQLGKAPTQSQGEVSDTMSSQDKLRQGEANISSPGDTLDISSASKGTSSASGRENFDWNEDEKRGQRISSSITSGDSSLPLPDRRLSRSPVIEQTSESSKVEVSRSGFMDQVEQPVRERPTEASGTEGKDGDLKRRKLQRNKQVQKERFDQWEEAYKLESEQRKIDEMFMMEALLEAKKAANTWEVPVGAVLVHHGKVIARGCNLVEELRDSTAHAEMICIREASNLLRTWRLAETTLYVTLEPCPMCAGAILQSRIDSLVWGAPNKLLGADGSWVRLFPSGIEGGSGSDQTNQPAGPVHPFHPNMKIQRGVLATECAEVMQQFFQLRRRKKEKKPEPPTPPSCLPVSTHPSKFISKMHNIFSIMFCL